MALWPSWSKAVDSRIDNDSSSVLTGVSTIVRCRSSNLLGVNIFFFIPEKRLRFISSSTYLHAILAVSSFYIQGTATYTSSSFPSTQCEKCDGMV